MLPHGFFIIFTLAYTANFGISQVIRPPGFGFFSYTGSSGSFLSHPLYLTYPYPAGLHNHYVVTVPQGLQAQLTIDATNARFFSIRPYDFAVIYDGVLTNRIAIPCEVKSYENMGSSGIAYLSVLRAHTGQIRTYTSQSNVVVVDFCSDSYDSGYDSTMLGFQAFYSSIGNLKTTTTKRPATTTIKKSTTTSGISTKRPLSTSTSTKKPLTSASPSVRDVCGRPMFPPSATPNVRIVNGALVPAGGMPWACALIRSTGPFQFCGCAVISATWVITAGHCVGDTPEAQMKATDEVYFGVTNLLNAVPGTNILGISRVILHPQFDQPAGTTNNDVALIKLTSAIPNWTPTLMPACLPTEPITAKAVKTGSKNRRICYVAGWGALFEGHRQGGVIGSGSDLLLQNAIEMFSAADCKKTYAGAAVITDKMLCGGYDGGKYDSCQGDSGGPLVCDRGDGTWTLNGVVSFGIGCAEAAKPGVYTNLYALMPWVNQTLATN